MKNTLILLFALLTLAPQAQTLAEVDMQVLINRTRFAPKTFIPYVEDYIKKLDSGSVKFTSTAVKVKSSNKSNAIKDTLIAEAKRLINYLNDKKGVKTLELSVGLYPTAKAQAKYLDSLGQIKHTGPNGITLKERTKGYNVIENACLTTNGDVIDCLLQLLIDYGNPTKSHRENIFEPKATQLAVAKSGKVWVQDFIYTLK